MYIVREKTMKNFFKNDSLNFKRLNYMYYAVKFAVKLQHKISCIAETSKESTFLLIKI